MGFLDLYLIHIYKKTKIFHNHYKILYKRVNICIIELVIVIIKINRCIIEIVTIVHICETRCV